MPVACFLRRKSLPERRSQRRTPIGGEPCALHQPYCYRTSGTPEGTRTPHLLLRRQLLYPDELPAHVGASDGNRTHAHSLEGCCTSRYTTPAKAGSASAIKYYHKPLTMSRFIFTYFSKNMHFCLSDQKNSHFSSIRIRLEGLTDADELLSGRNAELAVDIFVVIFERVFLDIQLDQNVLGCHAA